MTNTFVVSINNDSFIEGEHEYDKENFAWTVNQTKGKKVERNKDVQIEDKTI